MLFNTPDVNDFKNILFYINKLNLDNRNLNINEFTQVILNNQTIGFVRIKIYDHFCELCTLGIINEFQNKGYGKKLVKHVLDKRIKPVYVVTVIPNFFKEFGFTITNHYPQEIKNKLNYCTNFLPVNMSYRVMVIK